MITGLRPTFSITDTKEAIRAHQKLDAAVDKAYEASGGKKSYKSDAERVAFLFELYQKLTSLLPAEAGKPKRKSTTPSLRATPSN